MVEEDIRTKKKEKATKQFVVDSLDDECINYSTLLDNLPIPEDLFIGINFFNLASSVHTLGDSASSSSYSFNWDNLDSGSV